MEVRIIKKEIRKKELLNIAYKLFMTKGYENTSVDEIIAEAKIAKGTYYYYFESKEATLEKVIEMMIEEECKKRKYEYEIRYIEKDYSGADIAREYKNEENIIYVVGGDGTLAKTLPGLVGTKNKLGIIPAGSGNDTYRTIKTMENGDHKIDLGKINDTYFINVACTGTWVPSSQLYTASIIYTFFKFKFKKIKLKTKVKSLDAEYTILSICNGSYYGGGYKIAPKSRLTDGLLDIYYAEKMSKLKIIPLILKLKKGKHEGKRRIHKFRCDKVEINFEEEIVFNVDGEKLTGKDFKIEVLQNALWLHNDKEFVEEILD